MKQDKITAIHSFPNWLPQTQTWMYNQIKYLPEMVEVHVVCDRTENLEQFKVENIHSLDEISGIRCLQEKSLRKFRLRRLLTHLSSVAKSINADLIHSHFGHIGWNDRVAAQRVRAKHVITFYGADVNRLPTRDKGWLSRYRELFQEGDMFLCEGPHMAAQIVRLGCPKEKIQVHHLGIEVEKIPFHPRRWEDGSPLRVFLAAAFREKKGIPDAIQALSLLNGQLSLELTILGDASRERSSQKEKQIIMEALDQTGLRSKTRLIGFKPHSIFFQEAYKHHVFLSPSVTASDGDTEGGAPISILEAMATGMPVVSTFHCDIPEIVHYGVDKWLVAEHDVEGLASRLLWLAQHPTAWEERLIQGRRHVEEHFNVLLQGQRLANIYWRLLD